MNIDQDRVENQQIRIDSREIALFGDIHGNMPALTSVYDEIVTEGLNSHSYCVGDLVGYGPHPNEVVNFIRDHDIPTIQGNYDYGVGMDSDECGCAYNSTEARQHGRTSITWTNNVISDTNRGYLKRLAQQRTLVVGGTKITLVHGSPRRINEYLYADRPESTFKRLLNLIDSDVLVCGHTHIPYHKQLSDGRHIINVGSIGKPKDGDSRACYVHLKVHGSGLSVDHRRVQYDISDVVTDIKQSGLPDCYANALWSGKSV